LKSLPQQSCAVPDCVQHKMARTTISTGAGYPGNLEPLRVVVMFKKAILSAMLALSPITH
jgi:hypothetical protein